MKMYMRTIINSYDELDEYAIREITLDFDNMIKISKFKNHREFGIQKAYFPDGQLKHIYHVENDEKNGPCKCYYENGEIRVKCNFKDGRHHGLYKSYYENGNVEHFHHSQNGHNDGLSMNYYENGNIKVKCSYKNDRYCGTYESYHENGDVKNKIVYD